MTPVHPTDFTAAAIDNAIATGAIRLVECPERGRLVVIDRLRAGRPAGRANPPTITSLGEIAVRLANTDPTPA